ncbi:MAG: hybrid sensor histidine kinase/response regulator [Desulfotignum sp.]|jgi:signal transduction histidine kinase|nr:hybrid sensor histidine kinase/response regulator [Desulfotignum sp.]
MDKTQFAILVVDDEEDIRDVLEIALTDIGYQVFLAKDGKEALDLFEAQQPSIVITDIKMPVMGGIELLKQVKQRAPDTQVIMITGHGDMELTISSLKFGAADFITKPVNVDILELAVSKAVDKLIADQKLAEYTQKLEMLVVEKSKLSSHLSSLGLMIGTVSHNIKGLLTNLDGGLYIARSGLKKKKFTDVTEGLDLLAQNVDKIKQMIMDILMYSKDRQMNRQPVPAKKFLADIQETMTMKLAHHPIAFQLDAAQAPQTLNIDAAFMMSALVNILDNAVDACLEDKDTPDHKISLAVEKNRDNLVIKIADNGCGMDVETKEKIFDLFFSSKQVKGTGFGLFIAKNIIAQHQGTVAVDSIKRRGTTFTISLPQKDQMP